MATALFLLAAVIGAAFALKSFAVRNRERRRRSMLRSIASMRSDKASAGDPQ